MTTNLTRDAARHRSATLKLHGYTVEVDLSECIDPGQATYPTSTTLRLTCSEDETFLDFIGESVESVEVDGEARDVDYDGARVPVTGLIPGREHTVVVKGRARYSRSGEGMHRYVDPADGRTYLYTQYEPSDSRRVFANVEQPDLKAPFTFVITGPSDWEVLSNQPEVSREDTGTNSAGMPCARRTYSPTPLLSTYLTCICAGEYHRWSDEWAGTVPDGQGGTVEVTIPLGMLCRESLADAFDPDELFTITKQGLDFYHQHFAYPYPWGKYDSIFVPEYNLGAMENPGLVTFTDARYVFQSGATRSQHEARSNTVLHEMAHMWFGDLVTPQWWDDLWLKESFADYMGTLTNAEATEFHDAWTPFCARRKAWAYLQDQLPTTHPIVADIPDVEAAKQNFDGITYAKGASVLKQLVAYVGQDAFFAGARAYFQAHEFSATRLPDLLRALQEASGRDLGEWAKAWLQTTGMATLTPQITLAGDGTIERLVIRQEGHDLVTDSEVLRPHTLVVGLYAKDDELGLRRTSALELDVTGAETEVTEAAGLPAPDLIVVNDDDLTYAKVRLDDTSLATVKERLTGIDASLTRACVWAALWNAVRDGVMPAQEFIDIVLTHAPHETHVALLEQALLQLGQVVGGFLPRDARPQERRRMLDAAWEQMQAAEPGSGHQLQWARTVAVAAAACDARADDVRALLDGTITVDGLELRPELRWQLWAALAGTGHADEAELAAERERDTTSLAPVRHLRALSSRPDADVKAQAWRDLLEDLGASNDQTTARAEGFAHVGHGELTAPYTQKYFDELLRVWGSRSQELAQRFVLGVFPAGADLEEVPGGDVERVEEHPTAVAAQTWLDANADAPGALRRLIVEQRDHLLRRLRAQAASR